MTETSATLNQTPCEIVELQYTLPAAPCDLCHRLQPSWATTGRTAVDLELDHPVLLHVTVSLHYCPDCNHYFRVQPPFLRRRAVYTRRVVEKAVQAVYDDGLAMRRVPERLGRDFWVRPSESMVRQWCQDYRAEFDFAVDYEPWVVRSFSGILCVDEVYQDQLALLLAVDPAAPDGDRLIGYQLVHGEVTAQDVEKFLRRLQATGLEPAEVITDGSSLYPTVLRQVWPQAAHQLCLFHETRRLTRVVMQEIQTIRRQIPQAPPSPNDSRMGHLGEQPPSADIQHPATQRWYWCKMQQRLAIQEVHQLAQQGESQRAIARQTGHHRDTIRQWLQQPVPPLPEGLPAELAATAALPDEEQRQIRRRQRLIRVHQLHQAGFSHSAIARDVGLHRVTVAKWLQQEAPSEALEETERPVTLEETFPPPAPWSSWEQVRLVREALLEHRFLFLRRPEKLGGEELQLTALLESPVGPQLTVLRNFLVDWYRLFRTAEGQRRSLEEAQARYQAWCSDSAYRAVPALRRVQDRITEERFSHLSQFLHHPEWEATNNGAERGGRAFRHRQGPHFNLRSPEAIEGAIVIAACQRKAAASAPLASKSLRCTRGRKPNRPLDQAA